LGVPSAWTITKDDTTIVDGAGKVLFQQANSFNVRFWH
jgi:hypothetical protein